jgi:hypothetical protein
VICTFSLFYFSTFLLPHSLDAGCHARRVVKHNVYRANHANNFAYKAQFIAVEQPYFLDLVAREKRQEIQAEKFQSAVESSVSQVLDVRLAELTKAVFGQSGGVTPDVPPAPGKPTLPASPQPTPGGDEVVKQLTAFLHAKCSECHTGAKSKGTGEPFVLFDDKDVPQLTAGKLVRSDLMLYSNRMPPVEKLTDDEYRDFRAAYQTFEREIRAAAKKADDGK